MPNLNLPSLKKKCIFIPFSTKIISENQILQKKELPKKKKERIIYCWDIYNDTLYTTD